MVSLVLSILAGFLLSAAFAPVGFWFAVPVAIAVFLYAVTKTRHPFLSAFIFAAVFNYLTLEWSGQFVGLIPVLFLVLLQSVFYIPLGFISFKRDRYSRIWLVLPIILIADEVRSVFPFKGFGWNRLSFSQADSPFRIIASYLGDSSLTFLSVLLGIALYLLFARAQLTSIALVILVCTAALFVPVQSSGQGSTRVLAVQGNVPRLGLDFNSRAEEVFNMHLLKTQKALNQIETKPDFIVWPENAVDVDPFLNEEVGEKISNLARSSSIPIIVGAVLRDSNQPKNASIMWNSEGNVESIYVKRTLTPFGEYIPLRSLSELVSPFAKNVTDFIPGTVSIRHKINNAIVAPIICYELINDSNVNANVSNANLMVVQTNNATFADSGQSIQQLDISRLRAIEYNRWVVSVSTTGISAIIDNRGVVRSITKQNQSAFIDSEVALIQEASLAQRLNGYNAILIVVLSMVIYWRKRKINE
jgi:apolipoprotein N-acyltransferase